MSENTNNPLTFSHETFQTCAAVILGAITGFLISFPIAIGPTASKVGLIAFIAGGGAGALVGYRRRKSRAFLYFCFVAILVLAGTISSSLLP